MGLRVAGGLMCPLTAATQTAGPGPEPTLARVPRLSVCQPGGWRVVRTPELRLSLLPGSPGEEGSPLCISQLLLGNKSHHNPGAETANVPREARGWLGSFADLRECVCGVVWGLSPSGAMGV